MFLKFVAFAFDFSVKCQEFVNIFSVILKHIRAFSHLEMPSSDLCAKKKMINFFFCSQTGIIFDCKYQRTAFDSSAKDQFSVEAIILV